MVKFIAATDHGSAASPKVKVEQSVEGCGAWPARILGVDRGVLVIDGTVAIGRVRHGVDIPAERSGTLALFMAGDHPGNVEDI